MSLPFRSRVEHASVPWVERLHKVPRPVFLVGFLALVVVGALAPRPFGGIAFLLVGVLLGWFLFLTWPKLTLPERMMRLAVLVLAVAVGVTRLA